jgi:hypothetical protein
MMRTPEPGRRMDRGNRVSYEKPATHPVHNAEYSMDAPKRHLSDAWNEEPFPDGSRPSIACL